VEKHTVKSYDKEFEKINNYVIEMGNLVKKILIMANDSMIKSDANYSNIAVDTDKNINMLDDQIESSSITMLALRQPMAIDLRKIVGALKIAVIMERMGDLTKHICTRLGDLNFTISPKNKELIEEMRDLSISMLDDAITSVVELDIQKSHDAYVKDIKIDKIYADLMNNLQNEIIDNPSSTKPTMQIIFAVKNLERFADYITKIATIANYIITGEKKISGLSI
jgi:phosphate transport system protein